jgi:signal transduction histidine kinase
MVRRDDGEVHVSVIDQGTGIAEEILPHIFDRFYHLDHVGEELFDGVGLGLSITKQVIEQHNGTISVESEIGAGSTFTIALKQAKGESQGKQF